MKKIAFVGTDGRTFLSALEVSRAKNQNDFEEYRGLVVRGKPAMPEVAKRLDWPVEFLPTKDNSVESYAECLIGSFQKNLIDYAIVMPEDLLYKGLVDKIKAVGFRDRIAGLDSSGAFLEADKIRAKELCREAGIPVADKWIAIDAKDYKNFLNVCLEYIHVFGGAVVKYPYGAAGKGARVILNTWEIREVYDLIIHDYADKYRERYGDEGWPLLIESRMSGVEISFTALVDKYGNYSILPTAMDYPERYKGPASKDNPITGGMASISPHPVETPALIEMAGKEIFDPLIKKMKELNILRPTILYPGCFVTLNPEMRPKSIRVCEINIRPGEPEFQPVMRRLKNPGQLFSAMLEGNLSKVKTEIRSDQISLCIALVTGPGGPQGQKGYPWSCTKGEKMEIDFAYFKKKGILLIPSAMEYSNEKDLFLSDGTRVAYLLANGTINAESAGRTANLIKEKLLNAYNLGKIKVIKREDQNGNRLDLRDDAGKHFELSEKIFKIN